MPTKEMGEQAKEIDEELGPYVNPFDVWWGTLSDAMKLAAPVIVARIAFVAGQRSILAEQKKNFNIGE